MSTTENPSLTLDEARTRLARVGPNRLFTPAPVRLWAIAALERLSAPKARVRRAGQVVTADTETVVPGDVLIVVPGTRAAADARLLGAVNLAVDESALSGESALALPWVAPAELAKSRIEARRGERREVVARS